MRRAWWGDEKIGRKCFYQVLRRSPPVVVFNSEPSKRVVSLPCRASRVYRQNMRVACHSLPRVDTTPSTGLLPRVGAWPASAGPGAVPLAGSRVAAICGSRSMLLHHLRPQLFRHTHERRVLHQVHHAFHDLFVVGWHAAFTTHDYGNCGEVESEVRKIPCRGAVRVAREATTTKDRSPSVRCFPRIAFTPAVLGPDDKRVPSLPVWQNPTHTLQFGPSLLFFSRRPRVTRHCTKQSAARRFPCP